MYQLRESGASDKKQDTNSKKIQNSQSIKDKKIQDLRDKISNTSNRKIRVISAWRYPGVTDENSPIPEDILREIEGII